MEFVLSQSADRRPPADTLRDLRLSCAWVLASADFAGTFSDRLAELVPSGHPLRSEDVPAEELAVAVLDPVRDPDRYGGALDHVESRWHQLGAWLADLGMPGDSGQHVVRAVARTARDVSGEDWDSTASSGWAALQLWMQAHLDAGAHRARAALAGAPAAPVDGSASAVVAEATAAAAQSAGGTQALRGGPQGDGGGDGGGPARPGAGHGGGRRQGMDRMTGIWSNSGAFAAGSLGGAPPEALRTVHRAMGEPGRGGGEDSRR